MQINSSNLRFDAYGDNPRGGALLTLNQGVACNDGHINAPEKGEASHERGLAPHLSTCVVVANTQALYRGAFHQRRAISATCAK